MTRLMQDGPVWSSFHWVLRRQQAEQLALIKPGKVAQLIVEDRSYRILRAEDYSRLEEHAQWVSDMMDAQRLLTDAAIVNAEHPTEASKRLLMACVERLTKLWEARP